MHVPSADGSFGVVDSVGFSDGPATMYNLTVDEAHTFFVGQGAWLVHNAGCGAARLLEHEGDAGSYGALRRAGERGDNLTPDHMPQDAYMRAKQAGYTRESGASMNVEGGRHTLTNSYGRPPNLSLAPRPTLVRDIWNRRAIYMGQGLYGPQIRSGLLGVIRRNIQEFPIFRKPNMLL